MSDLIDKLNSEFPAAGSSEFKMIDVKTSEYRFCLMQIIPLIQTNETRICIISTSRNGEKLLQELNKNKAGQKNVFVLSGIKSDNKSSNVKDYSPAWDINSLKDGISYAIKNFGTQLFVFDSVTNLSLFMKKEEINSFIQKFIAILKTRQIKAVFINIVEETPDDVVIAVEGLVDERLPLERFLGQKPVKKINQVTKQIKQQEKKPVQPTQKELKQTIDLKSLKKSLAQSIREEARKIAEETRKNLAITETKKQKSTEKKEVYKLENEKEKQSLLKKLDLLQKSFDLGVISKKAFEEGKKQIDAKMKEL